MYKIRQQVGLAGFSVRDEESSSPDPTELTFWLCNYFFLILAHPVYKM